MLSPACYGRWGHEGHGCTDCALYEGCAELTIRSTTAEEAEKRDEEEETNAG